MPDTPDFTCVVFVPPDVYRKAQEENLIPSKLRVNVCLLDSAEATKVASLKKIPARVPNVYLWDTTMALLIELLELISGQKKLKLKTVFTNPSTRKTVYELPSDAVAGMANLPRNSMGEIAEKWRDCAGLDQSYFDDLFLDLLVDRIDRVCALAQEANKDITKALQLFVKGI